MTQATVESGAPWIWEDDFLHTLFVPMQPPVPQPDQDAELLKQLPFVPGLPELLMMRQVHALEHATVWVLGELQGSWRSPQPEDNHSLGGMSTERGFYLYGQVELPDLKRAVQIALKRLTAGEWDLAVHPRCGTNLSVSLLLTAGVAMGVSCLLPRGPLEQLVGLGIAAATAAHLAPDLGTLAQRYVTTSIPFNLAVATILPVADPFGRPAHFVRVRWVE